MRSPLLVDEHRLDVSAGIGISIFPQDGDTPEALLRNAHIAMQKSKHPGEERVRVYSPALGRENRRAAEMADALVSAVAQRQLRLDYQPIYTRDKEIMGLKPCCAGASQMGHIRPGEFIPIAERNGLIAAIGDWVISEVCRQAME